MFAFDGNEGCAIVTNSSRRLELAEKIRPRVFLIGGATGVGKTTLGCALAARIGVSSVTIDDLMTVARTVTSPELHPGLYLFHGMSYVDYFTNGTLTQFQHDAERQHAAVWPFVKKLILKHFDWTTVPLVLDGWHLRPHRVVELDRDVVDASWLIIEPAVLIERERQNTEFASQSPSPEKMFQNFVERSLWFNDLVRAEAEECGLNVLHQDGRSTVDDLCEVVLSKSNQN